MALQNLYEELYMELSTAAACSYALSGRQRNAALMRADVADALAGRGEHLAAAMLYENQARHFLREAWNQLAAVVLPKLALCQKVGSIVYHPPICHHPPTHPLTDRCMPSQKLVSPALSSTCLAVLSLPVEGALGPMRADYQRDLAASAALADGTYVASSLYSALWNLTRYTSYRCSGLCSIRKW